MNMNDVLLLEFNDKNENIIEKNRNLQVIVEMYIDNIHHMEKRKIGFLHDDLNKIEKWINDILISDFPYCLSITYKIVHVKSIKVITGKISNL